MKGAYYILKLAAGVALLSFVCSACSGDGAPVNCGGQWDLIFSETDQAASILRHCVTNQDCIFASPSYDCLGGCGVPLAAADWAVFRLALVQIADKYCTSEFREKCGAAIDCDTRYAYCSGNTCVAGK
jgi:hypothetical protein